MNMKRGATIGGMIGGVLGLSLAFGGHHLRLVEHDQHVRVDAANQQRVADALQQLNRNQEKIIDLIESVVSIIDDGDSEK